MWSASPPSSTMRSTDATAALLLGILALQLENPLPVVVRHLALRALGEVDVHERLVRGDHQHVVPLAVRSELEGDAGLTDAHTRTNTSISSSKTAGAKYSTS